MIRIRPYKQIDAKHIVNWIKCEKDFVKWCANLLTYPLNEEILLDNYRRFENNDKAGLFTALDEAGVPVGFFMMTKADYVKNSIHMGFVIVDSSKRHKGYGTNMMKQAIKYAFDILCVTKITLKVFDNNEIAHRCYLNSGFIDETYEKHNFNYKNEIWGCYHMSAKNM
ncbi:GNAT family N-acetyltransferase [Clostridium botulinum]|nr:GNAT family N-acetyltransferase [Clostridium botulinum]NFR15812.1 GNAT family N-acetyltransferase [Clostridium botulinum]NFR44719.1 GNAT family N-acetyltransferase [Clostridium botulinum]NFS51575.1 GNAT family N-acetyltransferase [Clostridium botulinum]